jgi:zona occludens toxin
MIILQTGKNGSGKTLSLVSELADRFEGRPFFYYRIKGLKLDWQKLEKPSDWINCPPNSVIVLDEVQEYWPARQKGDLPESLEKLSVHRADYGVDIVFLTPDPALIDIHIRRHVHEHNHFERKFGLEASTVLTWDTCVDDPSDKDNPARNRAVSRIFTYPSDKYGLYESAPAHTVKRRIPWKVYALPVAILLTIGLGYMAYQTLIGKRTVAAIAPTNQTQPLNTAPGLGPSSPGQQRVMTTEEYLKNQTARIPGLPHTAPAYDSIMQAKVAPVPKACIASAKRCSCYTEQATIIDMDESLCRQIASNGFFDPSQQAHQAASDLQNRTPPPVTMPAGAI